MIKPGRYPIWEIRDGEFQPFNIIPSCNFHTISEALLDVELPHEASLFLRGSFLEESIPHSGADIDIVIVSDEYANIEITSKIKKILAFTQRPIEVLCLNKSQLHCNLVFRLLLHTRSFKVLGQFINIKSVKADFETMRHHFFHYKFFLLHDFLPVDKQSRLHYLKQITRTFGVIYFLNNRKMFSRDIYTCIQWAKEINNSLGCHLEEYWNTLENISFSQEINIKNLKNFLLKQSEQAASIYLSK